MMTQSSTSPRNEKVKSEPVPFDLVIEILLRLPVKSIARFRCVSKLLHSTLRDPYFTDSFLIISSSHPKLLFTCVKDGATFFFSSPHPHDLSSIAVNIHMSFPIDCYSNICFRPVRGLVCGLHRRTTSKGKTVTVPLICNPSTGQSLALPKVKTRRKAVINYIGFDPIDKKLKVLCMTLSYSRGVKEEHYILTLDGTKPSWKQIKCDIPHHVYVVKYTNGFPQSDGICINGVLYYLAVVNDVFFPIFPDIICFEFRSNTFSYIKEANPGMKICSPLLQSTLVNYKGKLAKLQPNASYNGTCPGVQLWVLEDAKKHQWSSYSYVFPLLWRNIFENIKLFFVGTTDKGEIVLSPDTVSDLFYLLYYSPERNRFKIVRIEGMENFKGHRVYTFLDHVEDVKLVSSFLELVT